MFYLNIHFLTIQNTGEGSATSVRVEPPNVGVHAPSGHVASPVHPQNPVVAGVDDTFDDAIDKAVQENANGNNPMLDDNERQTLLQNVDESSHRQCEWMVDDICIACLFQDFQRTCIDALVRNEIKKTEIADAMAVIGMKSTFSEKLLHVIVKPTVDLPDTGLDDGAMMTTVKLYIKGQKEDAADILYSLNKKDRKIRLMLETLLEYLPRKPDKTLSESTFVSKYVVPIIQAFMEDDIVKCDL
ncbi:hypothetical protein BG004_004192 [Podila humilis]|nr:hypothetical protein BG004_004192 [Podila humilis]